MIERFRICRNADNSGFRKADNPANQKYDDNSFWKADNHGHRHTRFLSVTDSGLSKRSNTLCQEV